MFGHSVDIEDDIIAVGMPGDMSFGFLAGSVNLFHLDDNATPGDQTDDSWNLQARVANGKKYDNLGWDVAVSGDRVLAGSWNHIEDVYTEGAGFVFRYAGRQWHKEQRLLGSDLVLWGAELGKFVALDGIRVLLNQDSESNSWPLTEAVYVYTVIDDCNGDCVSDADELAAGAPDCNGNGVPDYCDLDCNNNSIPDECDLAAGTSLDCNSNGVPDECDPDCNNNDIPDDCDLAAGTSPDCNSNGIPDECDVMSGFSRDCTSDGVPDECAVVCVDHCECVDADACTYDRCVEGSCANLPRIYGDADHNNYVTLIDLFSVLDGFAGQFTTCTFEDVDVEPCPGNGVITLADLFAVLDAFAGIDACCGP